MISVHEIYTFGTYICMGLLVLLWIALLLRNKVRVAREIVRWITNRALFIAATIASLAMAGSLWFSNVLGWTPCLLCWYQRIAIFPQVFLLWPAWRQKFKKIGWYVIPLASVGLIIAGYHWFLQLAPIDHSTACVTSTGVSCIGRYVYRGFMTIAGMAFTALASIITLVAMHAKFRTTGHKR